MLGSRKTGGHSDDYERSEVVARLLRGELGIPEVCERYGLTPDAVGDWVRAFRRSSLKQFDDHVRTMLSRHGVDTAAMSTAELTGTLDEVDVSDLLQTMSHSRRDCEICVTHDGVESRIWCANGELVAAESALLSGEAAVYRVLTLEAGQVVADFRTVRRRRTIWKAMPLLLLEGARRKDECKRMLSRLEHGCYALGTRSITRDDALTSQELAVLRGFERPRAVEEVLATGALGDLETLTALASLVSREFLVHVESPSGAPADVGREAASMRPMLMSLLDPHPGGARALWRGRRVRAGSIAAAVLLAATSAGWLLFASPGGGSSSVSKPLAVSVAVPAPAVDSEQRPDLATEQSRLDPAVDDAEAPAVREVAAASVSAVLHEGAGLAIEPQEKAAPRVRKPSTVHSRPRAPSELALPARVIRSPRMQVIEAQTPTMMIVE
jgi:transposase-like protein